MIKKITVNIINDVLPLLLMSSRNTQMSTEQITVLTSFLFMRK